MRVVCIEDKTQHSYEENVPHLIKGNVYTVIDIEHREPEHYFDGEDSPGGDYYTLAEIGNDFEYHESCFISINEDQQDETEFERESVVKEMKQ